MSQAVKSQIIGSQIDLGSVIRSIILISGKVALKKRKTIDLLVKNFLI